MWVFVCGDDDNTGMSLSGVSIFLAETRFVGCMLVLHWRRERWRNRKAGMECGQRVRSLGTDAGWRVLGNVWLLGSIRCFADSSMDKGNGRGLGEV